MDWLNTPKSIVYKTLDSDEIKELDIDDIYAFNLENNLHFKRFNLDIDKSPSSIEKLSPFKEPKFENETIFVEVLVEGEANLYLYKTDQFTRYFYNLLPNNEVKQLVYKNYIVAEGDVSNNEIFENNSYKQQLFNDLKCDNISIEEITQLKHQRKILENIFKKYNKCKAPNKTSIKKDTEIKKTNDTQSIFRLNIRPGITRASLDIKTNDPSYATGFEFSQKYNLRFGLESELLLPFNKNKWSIILEPTYQRYFNETIIEATKYFNRPEKSIIEYEYLEIPIGIRYYAYITKNSKLFFNYTFHPINIQRGSITPIITNIGGGVSSGFGIGFNYKKVGFEFRYVLDRSIITNSRYSDQFSSLGFIFNYKILEFKN